MDTLEHSFSTQTFPALSRTLAEQSSRAWNPRDAFGEMLKGNKTGIKPSQGREGVTMSLCCPQQGVPVVCVLGVG